MSLSVAILATTLTLSLVLCVVAAFPARPGRIIDKFGNDVTPPPVVLKEQPVQTRAHTCCADLGCYSSGGDFFDLLHRPINSVPSCSLKDKLKYHLNTRRNSKVTQILDSYETSTIDKSNFNPRQKTFIIIHGFLDDYRWPWWSATVGELLAQGDFNVIRLDWSHGNNIPYYQASANVRLVGSHCARFVHHIISEYGVSADNVEIVGHSLGAHGAGYAGEALKKTYGIALGHITGLDPAGPYFTSTKPTVRLDPTDAKKVITIVTDGETILVAAYGSPQPMGHMNFYPNGGSLQPGCSKNIVNGVITGPTMNTTDWSDLGTVAAIAFDGAACSHARAPVLYYESINDQDCNMTSYECSDYDKFLAGECFSCANGKCANLGFHADTSLISAQPRNYYTITTAKSPFCTVPHTFSFKIQPKTKDNDSKKKSALVFITLFGSLGTRKIRVTRKSVDLRPGQKYNFFFETPTELGVVHSLYFTWEEQESNLNPGNWFKTHYIWLDGDVSLTDASEQVTKYSVGVPDGKVQSGKDLLCSRK
ncbi:hypothetical protein RvY_12504 [Ramazzottius varieornatus]|uniref:Lipase domain-containing protein n=1 Tax=Ramazzottius varieornatus TaxID=947166 RepID=A0A1D1VJQ5_RAMVA|nr:hypothetical protein RvY_12504 [Ramazzottius varieornatus]